MEDTCFAYTAPNRVRSACRLLINGNCVLVSDLNQGVSVTNGAATIATAVVREYGLDPEQLVFIEHYPADLAKSNDPFLRERCARVTFAWSNGVASRPQWSHVDKDMAENLLGARIEIEGIEPMPTQSGRQRLGRR